MLLNCGVGEDSWESLDCKEIQPVHPKGDQSWVFIGRTHAEAETPILWPPHTKSWLIGKDPDAGRDWGQEEKGTTEDEMAGWLHRLNAHEFGWTPGVGDGQGGLACCNSWSLKESDTTEQLNWTLLFLSYMSPEVSWMLGKPTRSPFKTEGSVFQAAGSAVNYQLQLSTLSKNGPLMKSYLTQGNAPFPTLIQWLPGRWMIYLSF